MKNMETDKSKMRELILNFPEQFRIGLQAAGNIKIRDRFKAVLVCAMGGSALPGDILAMWLKSQKINLPLFIHRNYSLPTEVSENHLVVCISYSGNTEETLSAFHEALKKKIKVMGICSGGELQELCQKHKIPFAKVPKGCPPRMALGYQFSALFQVLANCGLIKSDLKEVLDLEKKLKPESLENEGKKISRKLKNKIPLIYASEENGTLARIWKIKFNETSKIPAFYNVFPELNHNEMSAFENIQKGFHAIFLKDSADLPKISKRMEITAEILKSKGVPADFIDLKPGDIMFKIFDNLILSDWAAYYLAINSGVDPTSLSLVEEFKTKL